MRPSVIEATPEITLQHVEERAATFGCETEK
jgi:hypothetical protein